MTASSAELGTFSSTEGGNSHGKFSGRDQKALTRRGIALSRRVQAWHLIKSVPCRRHATFSPTFLHFVTTQLDYVKLNYSRLDSFRNHSDTCQEHSSNYRHRLQRVVLDKRRFIYSDTTWHLCLPQKPWTMGACQGVPLLSGSKSTHIDQVCTGNVSKKKSGHFTFGSEFATVSASHAQESVMIQQDRRPTQWINVKHRSIDASITTVVELVWFAVVGPFVSVHFFPSIPTFHVSTFIFLIHNSVVVML